MPFIAEKFLTEDDLLILEEGVKKIQFRNVPQWLGTFQFRMYSALTAPAKIPEEMRDVARKIAGLCSEQRFNTVFIQKYPVGSEVKAHRDPRNNLGFTLIAPFGTWTGAESMCEDKKYHLKRGDVAIQACTIDGRQGPVHSVSPVTSGIRYAIILNTIT